MTQKGSAIVDIFQRALSAHLPKEKFQKLQGTKVLVAGLGGGSNIAELLVRKGIGKLTIADMDVYEDHNVRQRGSTASTWGKEKVAVMQQRLLDINPYLELKCIEEGVTQENIEALVEECDVAIDMLDLMALDEKIMLYQFARKYKKYVLTTPSVINGAVLWVFAPDGITFEEQTRYKKEMSINEYAWNLLDTMIPEFPSEELKELYVGAAKGERSIPLDAVGVDQGAVMAVATVENIVFERFDHIIMAPDCLQVDLSNPKRSMR